MKGNVRPVTKNLSAAFVKKGIRRIMTKTPHEYIMTSNIRVRTSTYKYLRVHTSNIRLHTSNKRVHTSNI